MIQPPEHVLSLIRPNPEVECEFGSIVLFPDKPSPVFTTPVGVRPVLRDGVSDEDEIDAFTIGRLNP